MSHRLTSHNPDLKRLRDEGFCLDIKGVYLLVHDIPYVTVKREIARGTLVCELTLAGEKTVPPKDHTAYFMGDLPCDQEGTPLSNIINNSTPQTFGDIEVQHFFSAKPADGTYPDCPAGHYPDYYAKVMTYTSFLEGPAQAIDPAVTARTYKAIATPEANHPFCYLDTHSSRANIEALNASLKDQKIAIIGSGGTGSYVLDMVAKTPVMEIHLFDGDDFLSHNAFRAPGTAALDTLNSVPKKVHYLHEVYSNMHKHVIPHAYRVEASNVQELEGMHFVFICIDDGESRRLIFQELIARQIPFLDVGIGLNEENGRIMGAVRITTVTPQRFDHIDGRVPFADHGRNEYASNIQTPEVNALNAVLAVIKWKKLSGFYHDQKQEYHAEYNLSLNILVNSPNENNEDEA